MANIQTTETKLEKAQAENKKLRKELVDSKHQLQSLEYALKRKDKEIGNLNNKIDDLTVELSKQTDRTVELEEMVKSSVAKLQYSKSHPSKAREKQYNIILRWITLRGKVQSNDPLDNVFDFRRGCTEEELQYIKPYKLNIDKDKAIETMTDILKSNGLTFVKTYHNNLRTGDTEHRAYFHFVGSVGECGIMLKNMKSFISALGLITYADISCEENAAIAS